MEMQLDGFSLVEKIPETTRTLKNNHVFSEFSVFRQFIYKSKVSCRRKTKSEKGCYSDLKMNLEALFFFLKHCSFKAHQDTDTAP